MTGKGIFCVLFAALSLIASAHPATGILVDKDGSIYFVDSVRNRVMKWKNGEITVVFADPEGKTMRTPHHLFMTKGGDLVTVGDNSQSVLLISKTGKVAPYIRTSDQPAVGLGGDPIALAPDGSIIYITLDRVSRLHVLDREGNTRLLAGGANEIVDGKGTEAGFGRLHFAGFTFGPDGALYMTDHGDRVRRVTMDGTVTTVAGSGIGGHQDGEASQAQFKGAVGLTVTKDGTIYIAEYGTKRVRKISADGIVSTYAGNGKSGSKNGARLKATFLSLSGITTDQDGLVYLYEWAEQDRPRIRVITAEGEVKTLFTVRG